MSTSMGCGSGHDGTGRRARLWHRMRRVLLKPDPADGSPPFLRRQAIYPLLAFAVLAHGVNWPMMSVALRSISPLWMTVFRLLGALATILLITLLSQRSIVRPDRRDYPIVLSVGLGRMALIFVLVHSALTIVPPGRSSILVWTASLWTVPIAALFLRERMDWIRWTGVLCGVFGVLCVFEPTRLDWSSGRVLLGHAMLLGAALLNAGTTVHIRRHSWADPPFALLPWQLGVATVPVLMLALGLEGLPEVDWSVSFVAIILYQGVVSGGIAFWAQTVVHRSQPAISANLAMMGVPVIGLLSSAVVLDESLTFLVLAGLALIVFGVAANAYDDWRLASGSN